MSSTRKLWIALATLLAVSFAVLLWVGGEIHREMPPVPEQVVTESGQVVFTRADIDRAGQQAGEFGVDPGLGDREAAG